MVVKRGHYTRFAGYGITRTLEGHDPTIFPDKMLSEGFIRNFFCSNKPTVCLDIISLVASSCEYNKGEIGQHVAY
jgi:hypothetical protein